MWVRDEVGKCVYVSPSLEALDFDHVTILQKDGGSNIFD
jgi:hypothetical protein